MESAALMRSATDTDDGRGFLKAGLDRVMPPPVSTRVTGVAESRIMKSPPGSRLHRLSAAAHCAIMHAQDQRRNCRTAYAAPAVGRRAQAAA